MACMALCNNAYPKIHDTFMATSVDDKVIVEAAAALGMKLISRIDSDCFISFKGENLRYHVLGTQHFNSECKKERILVQRYGE